MYKVWVAYLLWLVSGFGALGFHRFYLNKPATGVLWIFTGGLAMVGSIYDFLTMSSQVRDANIRAEVRRALEMGARSPIAPVFRYGGDELSDYRRKESLERTILRVARKNSGIATPSEVALEADAPIEEAKSALEKLAAKGFAEMKIRKSGAIVFVFSEFVPDNSEFEDI
ncbi:MAG: TM2 domain-containing protein [Treponemataceae bacterium]